MRPEAVLAIDQGTSSTKALLVSANRVVLSRAEVPLHPVALGRGWVEQDPAELWDSVCRAGQIALAGADAEVQGVGVANQGETVLAWNRRTTQPTGNALTWQDRRATDVCHRLNAYAEELRQLTGLPLDPYFAAPKMAWLADSLSPGYVASMCDSWLLTKLTGEYATDAASASRTLLLDLDTGQWSDRACEIFGIDPSTLPSVIDCAGPIAETSTFGAPLPVTGAVVDQQAALLAENCIQPGETKCTYGTGAFLLVAMGSTRPHPRSGLVGSIACRLKGKISYCLDGQVYTAGSLVGWLQAIGLITGPSDLDRLSTGHTRNDGPVFVPSLAGLAAPLWQPRARGVITGVNLSTTAADLVTAALDGLAASIAWLAHAAAADLGKPIERLRVDGGLTQSVSLMQMQADLLQVPVEVYPSEEATAYGAAALAWLGAGRTEEAQLTISDWKPEMVYEPTIGADEAQSRLARWRRVAALAAELDSSEGLP